MYIPIILSILLFEIEIKESENKIEGFTDLLIEFLGNFSSFTLIFKNEILFLVVIFSNISLALNFIEL